MSETGKPIAGGNRARSAQEAPEADPEDRPARNRTAAPGDQSQRHSAPGTKDATPDSPHTPAFKRPAVIISVSVVLIILIVGGLLYYLHARHFESTDDAYIDGHVTQISPQVSAPVRVLHIDDNQLVHKGDLLVELDPIDYQVALAQAQAQRVAAQGRLSQAEAQVGAAKAAVIQAAAQIDTAQITFDNATRELKRYQEVDERARSRQILDNVTAAQANAQAQLKDAQAHKTSAEASVTTAEAAVKAADGEVRTADASVKHAEVNLSYCRICAPSEGRVTQRTIEAGTYVQTGQALFSLVAPEVWITANFKETQLQHMRPGQPVTVRIDAFPGTTFSAKVDSIQAGSGSRFSVLPAENATGNFVKVVQRVPVKIVFDQRPNQDTDRLLSPGLSVIPKVRVR
jgi:membrane fusion protein (multidrug efflux system)